MELTDLSADALRVLERALLIREQVGDRRGVAFSLSGLGQCYSAMGQEDRAQKYFRQAIDGLVAINARATLPEVYLQYLKESDALTLHSTNFESYMF